MGAICTTSRASRSLTDVPTLAEVVGVLDALYPPAWADDWDAVGTAVGRPEAPVRRVLLAVDPTHAVVDEAVAWGADLVLTHHPLLLRGVHGVAATGPKGRVVHALIEHGVALHTCHTNADSPPGGVSESMALTLAPHGISVTSVAPGMVATERQSATLTGPEGDSIRSQSPFGRVGTPEEIADAVAYLTSPTALWASGTVLDLNGASYFR